MSTDTGDFAKAEISANNKIYGTTGEVIIVLGNTGVFLQPNPTTYTNTGLFATLKFKVNENAKPGSSTKIVVSTDELDALKVVDSKFDFEFTIKNAEKTIQILETGAHTCTPAAAVRDNEIPATCAAKGSYDSVVRCSLCNKELSREKVTTDKLSHTPGTELREKEIPASCKTVGSYEAVVRCTLCNAIISSKTVVIPKTSDHIKGQAVKENVKAGDCKTASSYESVVYCTVCSEVLSRDKITGSKGDHIPGKVETKVTEPTCQKKGTLVEITKCSVCDTKLNEKTSELDIIDHVAGSPVRESEIVATCTKSGSYMSVEYCVTCNKQLSSKKVTTEMIPHSPAKAVEENRKEPVNCGANGTYDSVVYCSSCKKEISRVQQAIPAPKHTPGPEATETTAQICTVCNALLAPAIGHTHHWVGTWTSDNTGHWYACSGCSEKKDFAEHTFDNNCDADCNICGFKRTPGDHAYGSWNTVKESTATTEGQRERACIMCGKKVTESIPATGPETTTPPETTKESDVTTTAPEVTTEPAAGTSEEVTTESAPGTTAPEATKPEDTTDPTVSDPGCGSAVSMGIALIAILGTALIMKKRD